MDKDWRAGIPTASFNAARLPDHSRPQQNDPPEIVALREECRAIEEAKRPKNNLPHPAPRGSRKQVDYRAAAEVDARYAEIRAILAAHDGIDANRYDQNEK